MYSLTPPARTLALKDAMASLDIWAKIIVNWMIFRDTVPCMTMDTQLHHRFYLPKYWPFCNKVRTSNHQLLEEKYFHIWQSLVTNPFFIEFNPFKSVLSVFTPFIGARLKAPVVVKWSLTIWTSLMRIPCRSWIFELKIQSGLSRAVRL